VIRSTVCGREDSTKGERQRKEDPSSARRIAKSSGCTALNSEVRLGSSPVDFEFTDLFFTLFTKLPGLGLFPCSIFPFPFSLLSG